MGVLVMWCVVCVWCFRVWNSVLRFMFLSSHSSHATLLVSFFYCFLFSGCVQIVCAGGRSLGGVVGGICGCVFLLRYA